jgi:predicted nuclease of restriction endonuclease-like RecB superfamily
MLTADLVPTYTRRGRIYPRYIDPRHPELLSTAESLIGFFEEQVGATRGELEAVLHNFSGDSPLFFLHKGLIKLLLDRCQFQTQAHGDPPTIRRHVFQAAARRRRQGDLPGLTDFDRAAVLAEGGAALGLTPEQVEAGLYADLASSQILQAFETITPERLLDRYNTALAQAILFRATQVRIHIARQPPVRYRQLFRFIKFYQLLYRVTGSMEQGYEITLDGPLSLFQASQRYGVRLAQFLPVLLLAEGWTLVADLLWGPRRVARQFELSPAQGLRSHYPDHGGWIPEEVQAFAARFATLESDWDVSTDTDLIDLGGTLCIPDFRFRHRPTGRTLYLELFGFWRRRGVEERLAQLEAAGRKDVLLAVGRRGRVSEEDLEAPPDRVYYFRGVPIPREVLQLLEQVA